jgi:hypothetical protein
MSQVPASSKEFLDEIDAELKQNNDFINGTGRIAVITSMRMLFSDELVFSNLTKMYIASFVSNVDKSLDILLSKNLKNYALSPATKNLILTIIGGKLIAFLTRALEGTESKRWYEHVGKPQNTPTVR